MYMELQEATTPHDFLSLYSTKTKADAAASASSLIQNHNQRQDQRPSSSSHQGGFMLKTHDFLQPLENKRTTAGAEPPPQSPPRTSSTSAAASITGAPDINAPPPHLDRRPQAPTPQHVLRGGLGTFTISHVTAPAPTRPVVVKTEWPMTTSTDVGVTVALTTAPAPAAEYRAGPAIHKETPVQVATALVAAPYPGDGAFSLWGDAVNGADKAARGGSHPPPYHHHPSQQGHHPILQRQQHLWAAPPVYAAPRSSNSSFGSLSSTRSQATQDKRWFMDAGASNFSKGFTDDDDDDEDGFRTREGTSAKDLSVTVDGKTNAVDQKPSTPRSKHSATEQRRRSKINDRFQILRNLIPHTDQKRDKASFLLEVIEYIQFLQEKVQRYDNGHPGWNQDNANIPWKVPSEGTTGPSEVPQNGPTPRGYVNTDEVAVIGAPVVLTNNQVPLESENVGSGLQNKPSSFVPQQFASGSELAQQQQRLNFDPENVVYQFQAESARIGDDVLNQQELIIDDGTISISSVYSQGVLNALGHALQNSGVDLSQASVSVQINLGRRAFSRPVSVPNDRGPSCGNQVIGHSKSGSSDEESGKAKKRQKPSKS